MEEQQSNKVHKAARAGAKAKKKELTSKEKKGLDTQPNRGNNPRAFAGRAAGSYKEKKVMQSVEKREHTMHIPENDKTFKDVQDEPPLLVGVVGPPGSGKSTLIRSLVKMYSHRNVRQLKGPVTVVAGRYRRLTFMECPNTLSAMCDLAKVVDLVLLVVDGNFGFEMETFEFLSIAQVHGFPKIIGVVTHLDSLKTNKSLRRRKNMLRHRFWNEVAAGAKFLTLAPMHHGLYRASDIMKLHRLLVCMDTKPQQWRTTHGCVFADRHEDLTHPDMIATNPSCDRTVAMFGYVRGHPVKQGQLVHIPGLGDYKIRNISHQDDPCDPITHGNSKKAPDGGNTKMRHLSQKQKRMYAPYSEVGGIVYDENAVYVHEDLDRQNVQRGGEGYEMLKELQHMKGNLDDFESADQTADGSLLPRRRADFVNEDDNTFGDVKVQSYGEDDDESSDEDDDDFFAETGKLTMEDFDHIRPGDDQDDGDFEDEDEEEDDDETGGAQFAGASLHPRGPLKPDSTVIRNVSAPEWNTDDEAQLLNKIKDLFVTGRWTAEEGGVEGAKRNRDEESDDDNAPDTDMNPYGAKGYESLSEEEDGVPRVQKQKKVAFTSRKRVAQGEDGEENLADDEDLDLDFDEDEDEEEDADVMSSEEEDGGEEDGMPKATFGGGSHDDETQALLEHFIGGASGAASSRSGGASRGGPVIDLDEDEAALLRGDGDDKDAAPSSKSKKGTSAPVVDPNGNNSAVDDAYLQAKAAKRKEFEIGGGEGGGVGEEDTYDTSKGKTNTAGYYEHLKEAAADKKKLMDDTLESFGDDIDKKIALLGFFSGLYVRIVLEEVPAEFIQNFDPTQPLVLGGLNAGEDRLGMVHLRMKRHRWYPRILKAQDPVVISVGWRRIQSQPIFATEDQNGRLRYLKYTPEHLHCMSAFYGPVTPPQAGIVILPSSLATREKTFRIMATGYSVGADDTTQIVKKLKLTGVPMKIQKTTAFVKGMFNSDLEAAMFVGAKCKAVSGLRGMIKKVMKGKHGIVRCSFEDKLLMSDIVFIRTWKPVQPPTYCATVQNLIDVNWKGMRTMRELRKDYNKPLVQNPDSEYKEITRRKTVVEASDDARLPLSRNMRMRLPFDHKEDYIPVAKTTQQQMEVKAATFVAPEPREVRKKALIEILADRSAQLESQQDVMKMENRRIKAVKEAKDEIVYNAKIKLAKKESSKREEFKSLKKSKKK